MQLKFPNVTNTGSEVLGKCIYTDFHAQTQLQVALTALMHSHTLHRQRRYGVNLESYIPSFHLSSSPFTFGHLKPRSLRETQFWGHLSACLVSRPSHLEIEIFNGFSHFRLFKTCLRDSVEDLLVFWLPSTFTEPHHQWIFFEGSNWKFYFVPFQSPYQVARGRVCAKKELWAHFDPIWGIEPPNCGKFSGNIFYWGN